MTPEPSPGIAPGIASAIGSLTCTCGTAEVFAASLGLLPDWTRVWRSH